MDGIPRQPVIPTAIEAKNPNPPVPGPMQRNTVQDPHLPFPPQYPTTIESGMSNARIHGPGQLNIVKDLHLRLLPLSDFAIEEPKIGEGHGIPVPRPENGSAFMERSRKRNDLIIAKKPGNCVSCWKVEREVALFSSNG